MKQEKNATRKMSSIARKLHRAWVAKLIGVLFFLDIFFAAATVGCWCAYQEEKALGGFLSDTKRSLSWEETGGEAYYVIENGQVKQCIALTPYRPYAKAFLLVMLVADAMVLLPAILFDQLHIRRKLKPIQDMAKTAESLSKLSYDDSKFEHLESAIAHVSPDSANDHVVTNDRDLQSVEVAINNLLDRMRESYREQSRFVSDASHELRTPIAVIKGYTDMLDRWGKKDPEILDESIAAIKKETAHMNTLVEQLLFLARGDNGTTQLRMADFSLSALMREIYDESRMIDETHRYEFFAPAGDLLAHGDATMLKQSARIFLDNAVKYTNPNDTITIRVGMNEQYAPFFSIQDSGIGMRQSEVCHVFERFYRSDEARNRETGGTGLGLSIAKWIVDRHHGVIEVLSRPELGTRFTVVLPPYRETEKGAR